MKRSFTVFLLLAGLASYSQEPLHTWSFDDISKSEAIEWVSGVSMPITGYFDPAKGVKSGAIQFDGYTSFIHREKGLIDLPKSFTINVWIRLESYPWFRCPVLDLRAGEKEGLLFGVDRHGRICAGMGLPTSWTEITGDRVPLKQWVMISMTVDPSGVARVWMNGRVTAEQPDSPTLRSTQNTPVFMGRNAFREEWWDFQYTVKNQYSYLDGAMDELTIFSGALTGEQLTQFWKSVQPVPADPSPPRILPSGPAGDGVFGAVYTRLNYSKQWDRLWRSGDLSDVLVRFKDNNCRLVFWRGTGFVPCWVTENGIWYTNEWTETWGGDVSSCAEPLMDRDCRFSHVRIIENTPARVVVQWRYALVDADYQFVAKSFDGKGEWTEELFVIYPDGIGIRKIDLYYSKPLRNHDWEEAIVLLSPGQHPDEVMQDPEVTLINMKGEKHDYSWRRNLPVEMKKPESANIHLVNLKSRYKPFYIVNPEPFESKEGKYEAPFFRTYAASMAKNWRPDSVPSIYGWWNHWPVTPWPGDGRWVETNDQPSHFNLTTYTQWKDYYMDDRVKSRIMLHGMTAGDPVELVDLGKSWLTPPVLQTARGIVNYDQAQRAYVIQANGLQMFKGELKANAGQPACRPALVFENARLEQPVISLNREKLKPGRDFTSGVVLTDEGYRTVIWINRVLTNPVLIEIK